MLRNATEAVCVFANKQMDRLFFGAYYRPYFKSLHFHHLRASLLRLALTQISGTDIHCYFRNAVLVQRIINF